MRKIGELFVARSGYAAFVALACSLLPLVNIAFVGYISAIIVGFITLCRGPRSGLFVLAWVALPALALLYLGRLNFADTLFVDCALIWILAYALRRWGSWRLVFEIETLIGILVVIGVHLVVPNVQNEWTIFLTKYLAEVSSATSWRLTATQTDQIIKVFVPIATGSFILASLFWTWLLLFLARWWQATIYFPGRLREEWISQRTRIPTAIVPLIGALGFVIKQPIIMDLFPVLLFPVMMGGLSFFHYIATIKKGFVVLTVLIYLGLLLLPQFVIILVALVGFLDALINFRKYRPFATGEVK